MTKQEINRLIGTIYNKQQELLMKAQVLENRIIDLYHAFDEYTEQVEKPKETHR